MEATLNESTLEQVPTVLMEQDSVSGYFPAEADELDDGTELYIVDLRDTPLRAAFLRDGAAGVTPERIAAFLASKGFATAAERGVTVRSDGKVLIYSDTDPSAAWQSFKNDPTAEESATAGPLVKLLAFKKKSDAGTATAKDVAEIVPVIVGAMLKAYGQS